MSAPSSEQQRAQEKTRVEAALTNALSNTQWPDPLRTAVEYSLLAGGKRLRPTLVLTATEICGGNSEDALPAACAIEMIHTYSLIHDDLPAMDDDDVRRGRPTSHKVFGEALAILAGDALLTLAFETLATARTAPSVTADCLRILATAAGGAGMVGGQVLDLEAERGAFPGEISDKSAPAKDFGGKKQDNTAVSTEPEAAETRKASINENGIRVEQLIQIHRMKTGALITAALNMGAAVASATPDQRSRLQKFGQSIGLAFQIADDLLDVTGNDERLGKETGRDNELGKLTYPSLIGIEDSRRKASALVDDAVTALDIFDTKADSLRQLAQFIVERDH